MDRVRLGIVGAGNIAQLNVPGYIAHDSCDVIAVCDAHDGRAREASARWDIDRVYTDLDDLLADDDIDAVEILTPTHLHHAHVIAAARAGKHISCQKPMANSVREGREMLDEVLRAGVVYRISECAYHYPPLVKAKELIAEGAIGTPTMLRIKTVVGTTDSAFQQGLHADGYTWRFNEKSPGGHLFDDVVHKYATALWLFDTDIRSVQSVVRKAPVFFEAPTAALWEYERDELLGLMEVSYAPNMHIRSRYYGADEFFEVQGTDGFLWVTRFTGEMLDLPPLLLYSCDGTTHDVFVEADWMAGFRDSASHFIDALTQGTSPEMSAEQGIKVLQLAFAVYQASNERRPIDPASIDDAISPPWWPPMRGDDWSTLES
jgi:predicted dehydrogenase